MTISFLAARSFFSPVIILLSWSVVTAASEVELRDFTVRDSVEMSYFGTTYEHSPARSYDDGAVSPGGRFIAKVTHRGVLPEGYREGTIWLFDTRNVHAAVNDETITSPPPVPIVRMSATVNGQTGDFDDRGNILFQLRWSNDGNYIYFIGRDNTENRQLFQVEAKTGDVNRLSLPEQNVMSYFFGHDSTVYLTTPSIDTRIEWASSGSNIPDEVVGTKEPLIKLLYPNFRGYGGSFPIVMTAWRHLASGPEVIVDASTNEALHLESNYLDVAGIAEKGEAYDSIVRRISKNTDWEALDGYAPRNDNQLRTSVKESLNQPPLLIATDADNGRSRVIFDPNPQLAQIKISEVIEYEWHDIHGRTHSGGLVLPSSYVEGREYPLVIQTHGFNKYRFFKAGFSGTANAGRALASRGIVVLQVQEPGSNDDSLLNPALLGSDVYLSAVDQLSEEGIVDPDRVGISGYSFTGWLVADAITREPARFAAAVIANSDPLSLTGYFSYVDSPLHGLVERAFVGTTPFGDGINDWIERSPNFNTEKISAPVLIAAADPFHLISLWDLYAALRYQGKPVELQFIRTGKHNIIKPLQVVAHQELIVDWFDFWLNGAEASSKDKNEQYSRWRLLDAKDENKGRQ